MERKESGTAEELLRRNIMAWLGWCLVWSAGMRLVAPGAVLPALANLLAPSKLTLGLLGCGELLRLPTQLLSAWLMRGRPRVLRRCLRTWTLFIAFPLAMGAAFLWPQAGRLTWTVAFWGGFALSSLVAGFGMPLDSEVQGRIFAGRVGMVQGITMAGVGVVGLAAGLLASRVLASAPFPVNFGRAFVLSAAFYAVSMTAAYLLREPAPPDRLGQARRPSLRGIAARALRDRGFRGALLVYVCGSLSATLAVFYVPAALEVLKQPVASAGLFASVQAAAGAAAAGGAGVLIQRRGCRFVFALGILAMAAHIALMIRLGGVAEFYAALALQMASAMWMLIAFMTFVLERAAVGEKGVQAAVASLVVAPTVAAGSLLCGALIDHTSYQVAFSAALVLPVGALIGLAAVPPGPPAQTAPAEGMAPDAAKR